MRVRRWGDIILSPWERIRKKKRVTCLCKKSFIGVGSYQSSLCGFIRVTGPTRINRPRRRPYLKWNWFMWLIRPTVTLNFEVWPMHSLRESTIKDNGGKKNEHSLRFLFRVGFFNRYWSSSEVTQLFPFPIPFQSPVLANFYSLVVVCHAVYCTLLHCTLLT